MLKKNRVGLLMSIGASMIVLGMGHLASGNSPDIARDNAEKWIDEQGVNMGFDPKTQALTVVESASIAVQPDSPQYIASRQAAFEIAMQSARKSAAEFLAASIMTEISTKTVMQESFGEILGDSALVKALDGAQKKAEFQTIQEVKDVVNVVANAAIVGLSPWKTFESTNANGRGEIAIVAAMSPKYVSAILGNGGGDKGGQTLQNWIKSLSDQVLLSTLGTRIKADENGTFCVLAFGQARIRPESGMEGFAISEAKIIADKDLAFVHGQQVTSKAFRSALSQQTESSQLPASFRSESEYLNQVNANAKVEGVGIENIYRRTVIEPVSGEKVVVIVSKLNLGTNSSPNNLAGKTTISAPEKSAPAVVAQVDCPPVPENMLKATRQVRVKGTGGTLNGAIEAALMEAVRQEGTTVKGNSSLEKRFAEAMESVGNEVKEKVTSSTKLDSEVKTFSNGFIHSYAKISESRQGEIFEVELCANLVRFDPKNPRFGLPPTIAVIPFLCGERAAIARGKLIATTETVFEKALLESKQYQVIDAQNEIVLQGVRDNAERLVLTGRAQEVEALKLGNQLTADFVLIGNLIEVEFTGLPGPRPQKIEAKEVAMATIEAKLMNVANNEVIWVDTQTVIMKGRDLLLVRAGRDLQNAVEPNMPPIELVCTRSARALVQSLLEKLEKIAPPKNAALAPAVKASAAVIRVFGKILTIDASFPGVKVGAIFAIENPVEVSLPGGRKVIDHDRFGKLVISSITDGLAKATLVDGDSDFIQVGVSEIVLLTE